MKRRNSSTNLWMVSGLGLALAACGGGGDDAPAAPTTQRVSGVLLAPETTARVAAVAESRAAALAKGEAVMQAVDPSCTNVPAGYEPIANVPVSFTDAAGVVLTTPSITTDICGKFDSAAVPAAATGVRFAATASTQAIGVPISTLADRNGDGAIDPVSTFPAGAGLQIVGAGLFSGKLSFIVRDTITGKAVLGIPSSAIAVSAPSGALTLTQFAYTAASGPASISLVLDASGSMSATAATGSTLTRYQVTSTAAKLFADRLATSDEVGTVVFDNAPDFLNADYFATVWTGRIVDQAGQTVPLGLTTAGFTSNKVTLNRLADFYSPRSDSWRLTTAPVRFTGRSYPWGGQTALWDAINLGVDKVVTRTGRQFVVAMTDGADNASRTTVAALTTKAVAAKVPVFTVAIGSVTSVNSTNLQSLAAATGGGFTLVNDTDVQAELAGAFDSIRTGIQFQYGGTLGAALTAGTNVRIALDYAGLRTETTVLAN